ncbi:MAG: hypothetical protein AB7O97_14755 [Planctomycetota bacterium]
MTTLLRVLAAAALALPASSQQAQDTPAPAGTIRHDATTLILSPGRHAPADAIAATAEFLGANILVDPRELEASPTPIELQSALQVDRAGAEAVLAELLYSRGYVLVARDRARQLLEVLSERGPRGREILDAAESRTVDAIRAEPERKQPVTTVVQLQNGPAVVAINTLRPFLAGQTGKTGITLGTLGADSIVISGIQAQVARALDLLAQAGMVVATPKPAVAADCATQIEALEAKIAELQRRVAELERRASRDG